MMDEWDFEGTLVLEKLAQIEQVNAFIDAVASDDLQKASTLMKRAGIDPTTIAAVLKMIAEPDDETC